MWQHAVLQVPEIWTYSTVLHIQHSVWWLQWEWSWLHPMSEPPHFVSCGGFHLSANKTYLVSVDKKKIQELKVKEGLTFLKTWKWFLELILKTTKNSYASVIWQSSGADTATQTSAPPSSKQSGSTNISTEVSSELNSWKQITPQSRTWKKKWHT